MRGSRPHHKRFPASYWMFSPQHVCAWLVCGCCENHGPTSGEAGHSHFGICGHISSPKFWEHRLQDQSANNKKQLAVVMISSGGNAVDVIAPLNNSDGAKHQEQKLFHEEPNSNTAGRLQYACLLDSNRLYVLLD